MLKQNNTVVFRDFTVDLMPHPISGDVVLLTNADSIKQSLRSLLLSNYYDRPYQPLIGSNIRDLLFENISPITAHLLEGAIRTTVNNYEPRVELLNIHISPDIDHNRYDIRIIFSIINTSEEASLDITLNRIR